jgi:hypothetical protein
MKNLKIETIERLEEIKDNLGTHCDDENYSDMINAMIDYDNEAQDDLYLYDRTQELVEFMDDELLEQYVQEQLASYGVERVRCLLNNTIGSSIYKLDAYGNLENVTDDDFICCIDNAIETLKNSLEEEA